MQNIQSQLGKSLSLQLLMTVPRRNFPSNDPAWLQVKGLDFLKLLSGHLVRRQFVQNPAQIQKPRTAFRDATMDWLTDCSAPARL